MSTVSHTQHPSFRTAGHKHRHNKPNKRQAPVASNYILSQQFTSQSTIIDIKNKKRHFITALETLSYNQFHCVFQVLRTALPYAGARKFETIAVVELNIVSHLSCQCACRIQPDQCDNDIHTYDADSCQCRCRDTTEQSRCPSHKLWDHQLCRCVCPNLTHCVDGQHFSTESCL